MRSKLERKRGLRGRSDLAATVALATILAFAALVTGLATALALAGILAFTIMSRGSVQCDSVLTGDGVLCQGAIGTGGNGCCACSRSGEKTAQCGGGDGQCLVAIHDDPSFL